MFQREKASFSPGLGEWDARVRREEERSDALNRLAFALLSFQPCHRKTKRPRLSFSALTPVRSPLPPSLSLSSVHRRRDRPFSTHRPIREELRFSAQKCTNTHRERERERERSERTQTENMQQDVSVGQREKGVSEHTHTHTHTRRRRTVKKKTEES